MRVEMRFIIRSVVVFLFTCFVNIGYSVELCMSTVADEKSGFTSLLRKS